MQISIIAPPGGVEHPYGYVPMDVGIEILIGPNGQIGDAELMPLEVDGKTRKRRWLPDLPRTSAPDPIIGADKLDYYHPTRKPKAREAMLNALEQFPGIPELQWIRAWMQSEQPLKLEAEIEAKPKADANTISGGRIVWRLADRAQLTYLHELPSIQTAHAAQTLQKALGDSDRELKGPLPKVHSQKLAAPLLGCNDDMFCAWGQTQNTVLNTTAEMGLITTQRYTQLLEHKGHHISFRNGRYWVWGALPEMARLSEVNQGMEALFSPEGDAEDLDPVTALNDLIKTVTNGAKTLGKLPNELKLASGYIGIGGSGKGRVAIGQMTEQSAIDLLTHLLTYHQRQRRYLKRSSPYWIFGGLSVAEGSSKAAIAKANEQIFAAMVAGNLPPPALTQAILQRLKIEGVPNLLKPQKSQREWNQLAYLAWLSPDFIPSMATHMKPETSPENLLAWHVGQIFAQCRSLAYAYASRSSSPPKDWKNPIDAYRQTLFSAPAQGLAQILAKVSPYLSTVSHKTVFYHKALDAMAQDCPGQAPPKRWSDEQAFFLALGISQLEVQRQTNSQKTAEATA